MNGVFVNKNQSLLELAATEGAINSVQGSCLLVPSSRFPVPWYASQTVEHGMG